MFHSHRQLNEENTSCAAAADGAAGRFCEWGSRGRNSNSVSGDFVQVWVHRKNLHEIPTVMHFFTVFRGVAGYM